MFAGELTSNNSVGANSFQWDFCFQDLNSSLIVDYNATIADGNYMNSLTLEYDKGKWYGFISNRGNNKLIRLDYGNSLDNQPEAVDLGNIGGLFNVPRNLVLRKEGENWYGLISNINSHSLVRLNFGNSLENNPTGESLGNFAALNQPFGLELIEEPGQLTAVVTNFGNHTVTLIGFGNTLTTNPTSDDALSFGGTDVGFRRPLGIGLIESNDKWVALISNYQDGKIFRLTFNSTVKSLPSIEELENISGNGSEAKLIQEGSQYYAFILGMSSGLFRYSFGTSMDTTPHVQSLGTFGLLTDVRSLDIAYTGSGYRGFICHFSTSNKSLYKLDFTADCSEFVSINNSSNIAPHGVKYYQAGAYHINLTAYDGSGNKHESIQTLNVLNNSAPSISFSTTNFCIANENTFTGASSDDSSITSWNWDFGDGNIDTGQTVAHMYGTPGSYLATLSIETSTGCTNQISDSVTLYPEPVADFGLPLTNLCTNSDLVFPNQSNIISADAAEFKWNYNSEGSESEVDGSFVFATGGLKEIILIAELTGCKDTVSKQVEILMGPEVDFSWINNCFGDSISFINNSQIADISFSWDFDDGAPASTTRDPEHLYETGGDYNVKLEGISSLNGCKTAIINQVTVNDSLLTSFSLPQPVIENTPVDFTGSDLTLADDSITSWEWSLNDSVVSNNQNWVYSFSEPGSVELKLTVNTVQGCGGEYIDQITIQPSVYPTASFHFPDSVCQNENEEIINSSVNTQSYIWDFCHNDLKEIPAAGFSTEIDLGSYMNSITLKYDKGVWYGFVSNRENNKIIRLDYGNSLNNKPVSVDLGNFGGLLNVPRKLVLKKENEEWYGLLTCINSHSLIRLHFGSSLENNPTAESLGSFGALNQPFGLELIDEPGQLTAVLTNFGNHTVTLVDFGNSIVNNPLNEDAISFGNSSDNFFRPLGVSVLKTNDDWFGIISNYQDGKVFRLKFNSVIKSVPLIEDIGLISGNGSAVKLIEEGAQYHAFILGMKSGLYRFSFGNNLKNNPAIESLGGFGLLSDVRSLDIAYTGKSYIGFICDFSTTSKNLYKLDFESNCSSNASVDSSQDLEPSEVNFEAPGKYQINLTAFHENGNKDFISKYITVSDNTAPAISFSSPNACLSNPNIFTGAATDTSTINSYTWYVDDLDTLYGQEVNYQFASADTFSVTLEARAANGCSQRVKKALPVYEEPVPNFKFPDGILCSNSEIPFTNISETFSGGPAVEWSWNFNDEGGSDEESPAFTFTESGGKIVSLTASIPGCSPKMTKSFNVTAGPDVQFVAENLCFGETLQYINQTAGENLDAYAWDLGNGQVSAAVNPSLVYENPGKYEVQLAVSNTLGCVNTLQKSVTVHALPAVDFEHGLACSSATQFFDKSAVANANMQVWQWYLRTDEGIYDSAANSKDPIIGFPEEGTYRLKLVAGSNFGCYDSAEMDVTVMPGPDAVIGYDPFCLGDSIQFKDLSATHPGNPIQSWYWEINGKGYFSQEPRYYFESPGYHVVSLKVDAENLCSDTVFEVIKANRLPQPDFTVLNPCENESVVFADNSHSPDDPIASYSWNFDGLKTAHGPKAAFRFPEAKDYQVRLEVTTQNGCTRAATKQTPVYPYPKAKFSVYPKVGVPPQPVALENNSAGATAYQWSFGESPDSVAAAFEPQYTYHDVGDYAIRLVAVNEYGCKDTARNEIAIRLPVLDVELERVVKAPNGNDVQLVARINNNGSLIVSEMDILIELGDITLKESFSGPLEAGEGKNYPLNFQIVDHMKHNLAYACITLFPRFMSYEDETLANNKICIDLNEAFTVLEPFPNPTSDMLYIPFIAPNITDLVTIRLLDMRGNVLHTEDIKPAHPGMNQHALKLTAVSNGLYLLRIDLKDRSLVRKVRIGN